MTATEIAAAFTAYLASGDVDAAAELFLRHGAACDAARDFGAALARLTAAEAAA